VESSSSRHIVFFSSWYPTKFNPVLGIFVQRHARAAALFHRVTVFHACSDDSMLEGEFRIVRNTEGNLNEVILYYGRKQTAIAWLSIYKQKRRLEKFYRFGMDKIEQWYGKPDLLHLHVIWPLGSIAVRCARRWKIPLLLSEHWTGYFAEDGRYKGFWMKWLTRKTIRNSKGLCILNKRQEDILIQHALKTKFFSVPNGVDVSIFHPGNEVDHESPRIHLLCVAALDDRQKNIAGLLRSFRNIRRNYPHVELNIIGAGTDESELKLLSNELGLTQRGVNFKGALKPTEIAEIMRHSTALILNSKFENQPVVILEALCSGLSIISTDVGGISELVNESNGILFNGSNEQCLETAFESWLQQREHFKSAEIATNASLLYSFEAVGKQLKEVYKQIMSP
jgi:glycosyltransferase involved in cell wall biosynthesis